MAFLDYEKGARAYYSNNFLNPNNEESEEYYDWNEGWAEAANKDNKIDSNHFHAGFVKQIKII